MKTNVSQIPDYFLRCSRCGWETGVKSYILQCPHCGPEAFLQSRFPRRPPSKNLSSVESDFFHYTDWMSFAPIQSETPMHIGCIPGNGLGRELGLENLWLLLSCFAPQYGADMPSSTFKGAEALGVYSRAITETNKLLIVSSAGNAGVAFLEIGSMLATPGIVVVPDGALPIMMTSSEPGAVSPLLIVLEDAFYPDAIRFVDEIVGRFPEHLVREGGAFNVARRDAMAIPFHRAVRAMKRLPDRYFQAVGSGTGAIAAWEAARRLKEHKECPGGPMRLHLVQNTPFTPMVDAWKAGSRTVSPMSHEEVHDRLKRTYASVLANAKPPYGLTGGVFDILTDSGGDMHAVCNEDALKANALFKRHFMLDPCPEASTALAGLIQAKESGQISGREHILLHITGGGWKHSVKELGKRPYPNRRTFSPNDWEAAFQTVENYLSRMAACRTDFRD